MALYSERDYIVTAAKDGSIKVWNTIVFAQMYDFAGHSDAITGIAHLSCTAGVLSISSPGPPGGDSEEVESTSAPPLAPSTG